MENSFFRFFHSLKTNYYRNIPSYIRGLENNLAWKKYIWHNFSKSMIQNVVITQKDTWSCQEVPCLKLWHPSGEPLFPGWLCYSTAPQLLTMKQHKTNSKYVRKCLCYLESSFYNIYINYTKIKVAINPRLNINKITSQMQCFQKSFKFSILKAQAALALLQEHGLQALRIHTGSEFYSVRYGEIYWDIMPFLNYKILKTHMQTNSRKGTCATVYLIKCGVQFIERRGTPVIIQ